MSIDWQLALFLGVGVPLYAGCSVLLAVGVGRLVRREWRIWSGHRRVAERKRKREVAR